MTIVNDLMRQARERPQYLTINFNQVRGLAEYAHALLPTSDQSVDEIERLIRDGQVLFCAIPLRVLGDPERAAKRGDKESK